VKGIQTEGTNGAMSKKRLLDALCLVCGGAAAQVHHYGAVCCFSCRAFFRRGVGRTFVCIFGDGKCRVDAITRANCKGCRYSRCLAAGMKPYLVDATLRERQQKREPIRSYLVDPAIKQVSKTHNKHAQTPMRYVESTINDCVAAVAHIQLALGHCMELNKTPQGKKVFLELREEWRPTVISDQHTYQVFNPTNKLFEPVTIVRIAKEPVLEEVAVTESCINGEEAVNKDTYSKVTSENFAPSVLTQHQGLNGCLPQKANTINTGIHWMEASKKPVVVPVVQTPRRGASLHHITRNWNQDSFL